MAPLQIVAARLRVYLNAYGNLVRFTMQHVERHLLLQSALLDFVSAASRASVIGVLSAFASFMQGDSGDLAGWAAILPQGLPAVMLLALVILVLLLVEALARYGSAKRIRHIGRVVHTQLANAALRIMGQMDCRRIREFVPDQGRMLKYAIRDPLQSGIAIENIIRLFLPVMHVLMAMGMVIYFEPLISAMLGLVLLLLGPIVYHISRGTRMNAEQFYQVRVQAMSRAVSQWIRHRDNVCLPSCSFDETALWEKEEACRDYLDSFDRHRLASERMSLGLSLFRAGFVGLGLLGFAWLVVEGNRSWGQLVGFIGGLIYMMNGLQSLLGTLTNLNRLYPQVRDINRLIGAGEKMARGEWGVTLPERIVFEFDSDGEPHRVEWVPGDWLVVFSNHRLHRHDLGGITLALAAATGGAMRFWDAARFIHHRFVPEGMRLADFILGGAPETHGHSATEAMLKALGVSPDKDLGTMDLESVVSCVDWGRLASRTRAAILFAALLRHRHSGPLFVTSTLMGWVPDDMMERLRELLSDAYLVVVSDRYPDTPAFGDWFAWVLDERLLGLGDAQWLEKNAQVVAASIGADKEITPEEDDDVTLL